MAYLIERYNMRQNKILFLLSLLLLSCIGNYTSIHGFNFLNIPSAMRDLFWFYTGFYFEENRERINSFVKLKLRNHFMITALVFIQIILVYFNAKLPHFIKYFTYYILAISGMFLTYTACYKLTFSGLSFHIRNSLRKVSKNSYDLYLFSDPFNYIFISLLGLIPNYRILFTDNNFILAIFLLRFLLTSCGAIMIIKSIRLFQNVIKNR